MQTIGCIGCGNMGSALLRGFASSLDKTQYQLLCHDLNDDKMEALKSLGISATSDLKDVCAKSDVLILAVKPAQMPQLLDSVRPHLKAGSILVSIAASFSLQRIRLALGIDHVLVRCMPTLTAAVDHGIFALSFDPVNLNAKDQELISSLFKNLGLCVILPEPALNDFAAYIGAGPAFVFAIMHALGQAGLTLGFSKDLNRQMLIELFAGCAELARKQDKSFMDLRDAVCSPAGLTIAGVNVLDRAGISGLMVEAVEASRKRGSEMAKED